MSLLVVGSVAFDAVETPFGKCQQMLGGSASHFSISASYYTLTFVLSAWSAAILAKRNRKYLMNTVSTPVISNVSLTGRPFVGGRYDYDLNVAHTLDTQLNVFAEFGLPAIISSQRFSAAT